MQLASTGVRNERVTALPPGVNLRNLSVARMSKWAAMWPRHSLEKEAKYQVSFIEECDASGGRNEWSLNFIDCYFRNTSAHCLAATFNTLFLMENVPVSGVSGQQRLM